MKVHLIHEWSAWKEVDHGYQLNDVDEKTKYYVIQTRYCRVCFRKQVRSAQTKL